MFVSLIGLIQVISANPPASQPANQPADQPAGKPRNGYCKPPVTVTAVTALIAAKPAKRFPLLRAQNVVYGRPNEPSLNILI